MNDDVRPVLRQLVAQEGAAFYQDPRRTESLLKDVVGHRQTEIFVLVTALRAGVASELLATSAGLEDVTVDRLSGRLRDSYGLDAEASQWAVRSWAEALGVGGGAAPAAGAVPPVVPVVGAPPSGPPSGPPPAGPPPAGPPPPSTGVPGGPPPPSSGLPGEYDDRTRTAGIPPAAAGAAGGAAAGAAAGWAVGAAGHGGEAAGAADAAAVGGPPVGPPTAPGGPPSGPPTGPPYADDWGGAPPSGPSSRRWIPIVAVGVIAAVILAVVLATSSSKKAEAGEIFRAPAGDPGPDSFTSNAGPGDSSLTPGTVAPGGGGTGTVTGVNGAQPGLYGGTQNNSSCNVQQMIDFLRNNADKARAFASTLGTTSDRIADYLNALTPVLLRNDTRVTNHGFKNGTANALQSVLQAGTAALLDRYGVPRVRCACGNPLTPPVAVSSKPAYTGPSWPRFNPGNIIVVNAPVTQINTFVLVNINTGALFGRQPGPDVSRDGPAPSTNPPSTRVPPPTTRQTTPSQTGLTLPPNLGTGDVQVTLLWDHGADLDLHVIDPGGNEIYFSRETSPTGGKIDHDDTGGCNEAPQTRAENIFWPRGGAPTGQYRAFVRLYTSCSGAAAPYELRISSGGQVIYDRTGKAVLEKP